MRVPAFAMGIILIFASWPAFAVGKNKKCVTAKNAKLTELSIATDCNREGLCSFPSSSLFANWGVQLESSVGDWLEVVRREKKWSLQADIYDHAPAGSIPKLFSTTGAKPLPGKVVATSRIQGIKTAGGRRLISFTVSYQDKAAAVAGRTAELVEVRRFVIQIPSDQSVDRGAGRPCVIGSFSNRDMEQRRRLGDRCAEVQSDLEYAIDIGLHNKGCKAGDFTLEDLKKKN